MPRNLFDPEMDTPRDLIDRIHDSGSEFDHWEIEVDTAEPPADVRELVDRVDRPEEGFFGPGSMMWRVSRETGIYNVSWAPLLLQISHPKIAAAGMHHSDYEEMGPTERFERTFAIVDAIVFGDVETAIRGAMIVRRIHDWVTGELDAAVGPYEAGDDYSANDPELLMWVHATLQTQARAAYETYVGDLTDAEKEQHYRENQVFGQLFGVPMAYYPDTLEEFQAYFDREVEETLTLGDGGEEIRSYLLGESVFPEEIPWLPRPVRKFSAAGTLPETAREKLDLPWTRRHELASRAYASAFKRAYRFLPQEYRYKKIYRDAMDRVTDENSKRERLVDASTTAD